MNMPKYPCKNCVYFQSCGDNTRTEACYGRKTRAEIKADLKQERQRRK